MSLSAGFCLLWAEDPAPPAPTETITAPAPDETPAADPVPAPSASTDTYLPEASTAVAPVEIIDDIEFSGNAINRSATLAAKIKSKRKQPLDRKRLQDDVKLLFETGSFEDVNVSVEPNARRDRKGRSLVKILFTVVERPVIKRIDFKGNKKIRRSALEEKLQSKESEPFDRYKAALDERAILDHYRNEGYARARVEHYTSLDNKKKELILTFFITEGDQVLVGDVQITGVEQYSARQIRKKIKTRKNKVFKEDVLAEDIKRVTRFYRNNGHLDAHVSSPTVVNSSDNNRVLISLHVEEGPRYKVGAIALQGSTIFNEKELRRAIELRKGKKFDQSRLDESIANISSLYADKGYLRTEVTPIPMRNTDKGVVDYTIDIAESSVVYVDGVYVDGNTYTKEYVIKREVLLKPGDVFSAGRMRRSVERIYNLGFLEDVNVDVQQPRDPNLADLIFTVKEGRPGVFTAGAGFSSVDRFVGSLQVQHNNLFGRGQRMDLTYEFGARKQNVVLGLTDPWIFGYNMSGGVDLFNTIRVRDYKNNTYRERRRGAALRLGPRLSDTLSLLFAYTLSKTDIFDVEPAIRGDLLPSFGLTQQEAMNTGSVSQLKSSLLSEVSYDNRDNRFDATRGTYNRASIELAGGPAGGDINYYKPSLSSSLYLPTFWKLVLSFNARVAWATPFHPANDVPSTERFFLGGADSVRGYENNSIVARNRTVDEFGRTEIIEQPGRILTLFNVEYKFPIVQQGKQTIFQGAFFLDIGGTWNKTSDIRFTTGADERAMKAGYGFGFRFKTPVFPIRLDFGFPLNPRGGDDARSADPRSMQTYFTIGNVF